MVNRELNHGKQGVKSWLNKELIKSGQQTRMKPHVSLLRTLETDNEIRC